MFGFWKFYVAEMQADIQMRQTRLTALRADVAKGQRHGASAAAVPIAGQPSSRAAREPPPGPAGREGRGRHPAPHRDARHEIEPGDPALPAGKVVQQKLYAEIPYKLEAEGTYHNLGAFFDQISKFPRIINIGEISIKAKTPPEQNRTIIAECVATTFVLQEGAMAGKGGDGAEAAVGEEVTPGSPISDSRAWACRTSV